jgi:hypothetical protein
MLHPTLLNRRSLLKTASCGFGYLAYAGLAAQQARAEADAAPASPLSPRSPHFAPRAKRVIFLFMQGGPSHVDTFDYKPALARDDGKEGTQRRGKLLASPFKFNRSGRSGLPISELFPGVASHADDLCLLNGMYTDNPAHPQATILLHTGNARFVRPSLGSWVVYGLGSTNSNLPGFITINPPAGLGGAQNYGAGFLPAAFEGTRIAGGDANALPNLASRFLGPTMQRRQLDLVQGMNQELLARQGPNPQIEGLIESYELGFRMQTTVPDVMDLAGENPKTLDLYGINGGASAQFGRQCLLARRFAEAGVRFIEVGMQGWDQHNNLKATLTRNANAIDKPIAGLLTDLKQRGMLDETLVVWGGEFGRTPTSQNGGDGRDHNNRGYSMWMAGGGIKGGLRHGATDEHGTAAVDGKIHIHDLHATILNQLGLNHEHLTYRYAGRDFRLTDVYGNVVREVLA